MIVRGRKDAQDEESERDRVLTDWPNNLIIRRDVAGLRTAVIVQTRWRDAWLDKAK